MTGMVTFATRANLDTKESTANCEYKVTQKMFLKKRNVLQEHQKYIFFILRLMLSNDDIFCIKFERYTLNDYFIM